MKKELLKNTPCSYISIFVIGLLAGALTRLTDFCDASSLWGFQAIATLFGFWIISVTAIVLLSASHLCAGLSAFLYLFGMTLSFYGLRFLLNRWVFHYEDSRFDTGLFLLYTALSAACGAGAFLLRFWERGTKPASLLYGLPVGALLAEALGVALYLAGHGTYLFQLLLDLAGAAFFGWLFYRRAGCRPLYLGSACLTAFAVYLVVYRPFL